MIDELVARIREAPDDDAPRMVLADELMEAGDPWGEIIALSCRQARLGETPEADDLRERVQHLKKQVWPTEAFAGSIKRGFFDFVWANDDGVREVRGPAFALMSQLRVREMTNAGLDALAEMAMDVGDLRLEAKRESHPSGERLVPALARMRCRRLSVRHIAFERKHLDELLAAPIADELRALALCHPELTGMLDDVAWPPLDALDLSLRLQSSDVVALMRSPQLHGLAALELSFNPIDDDGVRAIAATPFTRLTSLELQGIDLGDSGITALADAPALRRLTKLAIGRRYETLEDSLPRLAAFAELTDFELDCQTSAGALRALYANLRAPLRRLAVLHTGVYGTDCIPDFDRLRELRILELPFQSLGDSGATAIAAADLPHLELLELQTCHIGPEGARALAESQTLPRDLEISLYGNVVGEYADPLRKRYRKVILGGT